MVCGHRRSHVIKGATGKAVHTEGGADTLRNTQKTICVPLQESCYSTDKAVYTERGAHTRHKRRSVATAGVMLFRGHRQGGTHRRRCTHKAVAQKAVCGHRRSHVIKGGHSKAVHTEGGAHTRRCVHTKGGLWPPQESCY